MTEYELISDRIKFFLEYRLKLLGVYVTINSLLLAISVSQIQGRVNSIVVSLFALTMTLIFWMVESRVNRIVYIYRHAAVKLGADSGMEVMAGCYEEIKSNKLKLMHLFWAIYLAGMVSWLGFALNSFFVVATPAK